MLAHSSDTPVAGIKEKRHGLNITVEHPRGTLRVLHNDKGEVVYKQHMHHSYGYFNKTKGRDGDEVDCFLGPFKDAKEVYTIHMRDLGPDKNAREDEDKCFVGFPTADAAKAAFLLHYPRDFYNGMTALPVDLFKKKLKTASLPYRHTTIHAVKGQSKGSRKASRSLDVAKLALLGLFVCLIGRSQSITGTVLYANGNSFNGTLQISVARGPVTATCSGGLIVPNVYTPITITGGSISSSVAFPTHSVAQTFTGTGINDLVIQSGAQYFGKPTYKMCVRIDGSGTFSWGDTGTCDNGGSGIAIIGSSTMQTIGRYGIGIAFAGTSHTVGDLWTVSVSQCLSTGQSYQMAFYDTSKKLIWQFPGSVPTSGTRVDLLNLLVAGSKQ